MCALAFEYLHISLEIIQPTKHRAKGERKWGMWTLSWQLECGLGVFQWRIKSCCSVAQAGGNQQRLGVAELGIRAAQRRLWGCSKWGCRWKIHQMSFIQSISKWAVVFSGALSPWSGERCVAKLLSVLCTGFCPGLGGKTRAFRACLILLYLLWGHSNTWSPKTKNWLLCPDGVCFVTLSPLSLVCLVLCNMCIICKLIWIKRFEQLPFKKG